MENAKLESSHASFHARLTGGAHRRLAAVLLSGLAMLGWSGSSARTVLEETLSFREDSNGIAFAVNRHHDFRIAIDGWGATLRSNRNEGTFSWRIGLHALGREHAYLAVPTGRARAAADRATIVRDGVDEWYVNRETGIEHGFTLQVRPVGDGRLVLRLSVETDLQVATCADGVEYRRADGAVVVRYDHLLVFDAAGRELASRLEQDGDTLIVAIDDTGAQFPVTIDPLATNPAWSGHGDQSTAHFGYSVAGAGDPNGDGVSDLLIGAPSHGNGETDEGRVSLYRGSSFGLPGTPLWIAECDQAFAGFGTSVAILGDVNGDGFDDVAIGAPMFDDSATDQGRVFVYFGGPSGPSVAPDWIYSGSTVGGRFGRCVASAGDVDADGYVDLLIGAVEDLGPDLGQAYLFPGSNAGPLPTPTWTAVSGSTTEDWFGWSVAGLGDVNGDGWSDVGVAAPLASPTIYREGEFHVFHGTPVGPWPVAQLVVASGGFDARLGACIASAGDVDADGFADLVVGASSFSNGEAYEGAAFVHRGGTFGIAPIPIWSAESNQIGALFGISVSTAGDVDADGHSDIVIGAPSYDGALVDDGRVSVYLGTSAGVSATEAWKVDGDQSQAQFGNEVSLAGDVDATGFPDLAIGAHLHDAGQNDEGLVQIHTAGGQGAATPYGIGKPGTNGVPRLSSSAPPKLGATSDLTLSFGLPGATSVFVVAGLSPASINFDKGRLLVTPGTFTFVSGLDDTGGLVIPMTIPHDPLFCGANLYFQFGLVDPAAIGPYHTALSNGLHWTIGG